MTFFPLSDFSDAKKYEQTSNTFDGRDRFPWDRTTISPPHPPRARTDCRAPGQLLPCPLFRRACCYLLLSWGQALANCPRSPIYKLTQWLPSGQLDCRCSIDHFNGLIFIFHSLPFQISHSASNYRSCSYMFCKLLQTLKDLSNNCTENNIIHLIRGYIYTIYSHYQQTWQRRLRANI